MMLRECWEDVACCGIVLGGCAIVAWCWECHDVPYIVLIMRVSAMVLGECGMVC